MKPAQFDYHAPRTIEEAVALLAELAPADGRVLAGGQSLVPMMAFRMAKPGHLIDINNVAGLDRLGVEGKELVVGALVRHADFETPAEPGPTGRLLAKIMRSIAHGPIRARGTFCGSLAHADPASEWCMAAVLLGAEIVARSKKGARRIKAAAFFQGVMSTALEAEELLEQVRIPLLPADTRVGFNEFSRRAGDFAMGMAAVAYRLEGGKVAEPRIAIGGIEPQPRRLREAEAALAGAVPGPDAFRKTAEAAATASDPMEDIQTSADYRRDLVLATVTRALEQAA
jgi:aerobic carbon-monoxide dehydrogenase medium subunit